MPTRNINLTPELSELIDAEVASGRYQNASEVVRAGLRLLERSREEQVVRLQALHRVLDAAIVQADAALADGNRLMVIDPGQARRRLEAAVERYAAVNAERPSSLAAQRGIFGLARARESLGELTEARRGYEALVAEYPDSPYRTIAEQRAAVLSRESTQQWYDWFASRPAAAAGAQPPTAESSDAPAQPSSANTAPAVE